MHLDYYDLQALPTLSQGHTADLKIDTGTLRVWLSRMTIADGELEPVQIERLRDGRWVDTTREPGEMTVCGGIPRAGVRCGGKWLRADGSWE